MTSKRSNRKLVELVLPVFCVNKSSSVSLSKRESTEDGVGHTTSESFPITPAKRDLAGDGAVYISCSAGFVALSLSLQELWG